MSHIKICSWNANGLREKIGELREFLDRNKIDIMLINDTRYNDRMNLKISNYKTIRKDANSAAGGLAILVKYNIPFTNIKIPNNIKFESLCIKLHPNIYLISAYCSPKIKYTMNEINTLLNIGDKVLLIGDLNATHILWGCRRNNSRGKTIFEYAQRNNCTIMYTDEDTHYPMNGSHSSKIDIGINKNVNNISTLTTVAEMSSDHNPVICNLGNLKKEERDKKTLDYKNAKWEEMRQIINKKIQITNKINSKEKIDEELKKLTKIIQKGIKKTIKNIPTKKNMEELPDSILIQIKRKNRIRKIWQQTRQARYKIELNQQVNEIKKQIKEHRNDRWTKQLEKLKPTDNSLWRMTKIFKSEHKTIPTLKNNNMEAVTDAEKAEMLAEQFKQVHNKNINNTKEQEEIAKITIEELRNICTENMTVTKTTPNEITEIIKKLPNKKAPGKDNIQNIVLKQLPKKAIVQFMHIINAIMKLMHFPDQWKTSNIIPIPKPGKDADKPVSYRPISLLPTLSKVAEKIILTRLNKFEKDNNISISEQFGFKEKHSTIQQLARITTNICENYNKNMVTVMTLLDIEKAFDRVWIEGVIKKMLEQEYPKELIKLIYSYLTGRKIQVTINNKKSNKKIIKAGVPQGSVLGPKIFNIYLNDIPKFEKTNLALFADDTAIYANSHSAIVAAKQIQIHMSILEPYYNKWKIKLNEDKTEVIVFTRKTKEIKIISPIKIYGHKTQPKTVVKYLGVMLDTKLRYKQHIKHALKKAYAIQRKMYPLLTPNSNLNLKNKLLIYKMIIRPIIAYASPIWCGASKSNIKPLQIYQNKCLRLITMANRYTRITDLHIQAGMKPITETINQLANNFYTNMLGNNELTINLTKIRANNIPPTWKHKLPYQNLEIFNRMF